MQPSDSKTSADEMALMQLLAQGNPQQAWQGPAHPHPQASTPPPAPAAQLDPGVISLLLQMMQQQQQAQPPPAVPVPEVAVAPPPAPQVVVSQAPALEGNALLQHILAQTSQGQPHALQQQLRYLLEPQQAVASGQHQVPNLPVQGDRAQDAYGTAAGLIRPSPGSARAVDVAGPSRATAREDALTPLSGGVAKPGGDSKQKNREAQRRFRERQKQQINELKERAQQAEEEAQSYKAKYEQAMKEIAILSEQLTQQHPQEPPQPPPPTE